jgi:hypothetical protein
MSNSIDMSDVFTEAGIAKLKQGQLLRFRKEGKVLEYIVTKLNRKSSKVYARETQSYDLGPNGELPKELVEKMNG